VNKWNRQSNSRLRRVGYLLLTLAAFGLASCSGSGPASSLEPKGPVAEDIDVLWNIIFWAAVVVFVLVEGALVYALIRFREGRDPEHRPKQVHGNTRLEVVWTIIPAVILAIVAVPTLTTLFSIRKTESGPGVLELEITGHQWWWEIDYPAAGLETANEIHIPEDTEVRITLTSADVIHSFWVPPLAGKRDAVPGRITTMKIIADDPTLPGEPIPGQCAEFCGLAHADMRFKVFVHTAAGYQAWVDAQLEPATIPTTGAMAAGWETFSQVCTSCHQAQVVDETGTVTTVGQAGNEWSYAPDLTHFGSRTTFAGAKYENTTELLTEWLHDPSLMKPMDPERNDIPNGRILGMPNFNLTGAEIDDLIALLQDWK
jgi:cytochrome c oxidase subunit 2